MEEKVGEERVGEIENPKGEERVKNMEAYSHYTCNLDPHVHVPTFQCTKSLVGQSQRCPEAGQQAVLC